MMRMNRRLDRYLIAEVLPLVVAGLLVVVLLMVLAALKEVIAPILAKGASPLLVLKLLAFNLPEAISRGLPLSLLFAVLLGMSRLTSDSEIKSALAGGISPARLMAPIMLLSAGVALLSFLNSELLVPKASNLALQTQRDIILDNPRVLVKEGTVFKDGLNRAIYIDKIEANNRLVGIQIIQMGVSDSVRELMTAKTGYLDTKTATIILQNGERVTYRDAKPLTIASFKEARLPVQDLQSGLQGRNEVLPVQKSLAELSVDLQNIKASGGRGNREYTALHRKFAEPFAAVAFGFFGVCLALFTFRVGGGLGLVWVLLLTFAYYATWSVFRIMGEQGALSPLLAAWSPDFIYIVAGFILLLRSRNR